MDGCSERAGWGMGFRAGGLLGGVCVCLWLSVMVWGTQQQLQALCFIPRGKQGHRHAMPSSPPLSPLLWLLYDITSLHLSSLINITVSFSHCFSLPSAFLCRSWGSSSRAWLNATQWPLRRVVQCRTPRSRRTHWTLSRSWLAPLVLAWRTSPMFPPCSPALPLSR